MSTVHPLPPIHVWINETPPFETTIQEKLNDIRHKTCRLCEIYRNFIIMIILCLCIGSIVISVMIKSKNTMINPCYYYTDNTLASDVSEQCITYLWNSAQCSTALQSNPTWRWWIQSPQGLTRVNCDVSHTGSMCGAGSYQTIRIYVPTCNSNVGR